MKNKVLIKLIIPTTEESYDIFIPVNEVIWKIKKLIVKFITETSGFEQNLNTVITLINKSNSRIYNNNEIVIDTDIRNGTELILLLTN